MLHPQSAHASGAALRPAGIDLAAPAQEKAHVKAIAGAHKNCHQPRLGFSSSWPAAA
jgi:hypothetical protein